MSDFHQAILASQARIVRHPDREGMAAHLDQISHTADVPIVLRVMEADCLVTLNCKHFIDDSSVGRRLGLRIDTPGEALGWARGKMAAGR